MDNFIFILNKKNFKMCKICYVLHEIKTFRNAKCYIMHYWYFQHWFPHAHFLLIHMQTLLVSAKINVSIFKDQSFLLERLI